MDRTSASISNTYTPKTRIELLNELKQNKLLTEKEVTLILETSQVTIGSKTIVFEEDEAPIITTKIEISGMNLSAYKYDQYTGIDTEVPFDNNYVENFVFSVESSIGIKNSTLPNGDITQNNVIKYDITNYDISVPLTFQIEDVYGNNYNYTYKLEKDFTENTLQNIFDYSIDFGDAHGVESELLFTCRSNNSYEPFSYSLDYEVVLGNSLWISHNKPLFFNNTIPYVGDYERVKIKQPVTLRRIFFFLL